MGGARNEFETLENTKNVFVQSFFFFFTFVRKYLVVLPLTRDRILCIRYTSTSSGDFSLDFINTIYSVPSYTRQQYND